MQKANTGHLSIKRVKDLSEIAMRNPWIRQERHRQLVRLSGTNATVVFTVSILVNLTNMPISPIFKFEETFDEFLMAEYL